MMKENNTRFLTSIHNIKPEEFKLLYTCIKRSNTLFKTECVSLDLTSFHCVKIELPKLLESSKFIEAIQLVLKENDLEKNLEEIDQLSAKKLLPFLFWIFDSLQEIGEKEAQLFNQPTAPEEIQAGIHNFEQFGIINILDALAGGDILKWDAIAQLCYLDVRTKLYKNQVTADFQKAYSDILIKKSKAKR